MLTPCRPFPLFRFRSPIREHKAAPRFAEPGKLFFGNDTEIPDSAQLYRCGRTPEIVKSVSNFSIRSRRAFA